MTAKSSDPAPAPQPSPSTATTPPAPAPTPAPTPAKSAPKAPAPARPAKPGRSGNGAAYVLAVLAMLIAVGSTAVAVYALDVAREAKSKAADTVATAPRPSATAPSSPAAAANPTPSTTASRSQFTPELVRADLRIPAAQRCNAVYVDVDTLQVGNLVGHEFYLSSCLGPTTVRIDETSGAVPTGDSPTPEVCAAQLAGTSTSTTELVLQVRTGLTFCLLTSKDEATRQHIPQRIAIVEIRDFAVDGSVVAAVSTYRVPTQN